MRAHPVADPVTLAHAEIDFGVMTILFAHDLLHFDLVEMSEK